MNRSSPNKGRQKNRSSRPPRDTGVHEPTDLLRQVCLWLLVAICVATPLVTSEGAVRQGTGIGLILMWLLLAFFWSLSILAGEAKARVDRLDALPIALIFVFVISGVATAEHSNLRLTLNMTWVWLSLVVAFLMFRQLVVQQLEIRALFSVMIALAAVLASYGLYQAFYDLPRQRAEFQRNPQKVLREARINAPPGSPIRAQFADRLNSREPFATFALTNSLAGYLVPWFVMLAAILLTVFTAGDSLGEEMRSYAARRAAAVGLLVLLLACLLLTKSRSALLAIGVGSVMLLAWSPSKRWLSWKVIVPSGAVLGLLLVVGYLLKGLDFQLLTQAGLSLTYRMQYWRATMAMILDRWDFGCGPGNFQAHYMGYKFPESSESVTDPHNFLLEIWAMVGTFGLILVATLIVLWLRLLLHDDKPDRDEQEAEEQGAFFSHWTMYGGAAFGLFLAYPCGGLMGLSPSWSIVPHIAAGILMIWVLHPWVVRGHLPRRWIVVAWLALTVNLLAAGGISYSGVAICWWLLLACGINCQDKPRREVPRSAGWAFMLMSIMGLSFYTTNSLYPVWNAHAASFTAEFHVQLGQFSTAQRAFQDATRADPYAAPPWLRLCLIQASAITKTSSEQQLAAFRETMDQFKRRDPQSPATHQACGDLNLRVFRATRQREFLERASASYELAQQRYPSDAMSAARLAYALNLLGKKAEAAERAAEALRLDELNPHQERKLARQRIADPILGGDADAEQQMKKIRN